MTNDRFYAETDRVSWTMGCSSADIDVEVDGVSWSVGRGVEGVS